VPPAATGVPRQPSIAYLLRKNDITLLRWAAINSDVNGNPVPPTAYRIYRSNNANLETFDLIATIASIDVNGLVDTMFSEQLVGFFAYGVTAVNTFGESTMDTAEAVSSTNDLDLFD
jgi:hypothetical protein